MAFEIEYFHKRVRDEIESWPIDVVADYARLVELLTEYGPSLCRILALSAMVFLSCDREDIRVSEEPCIASS